MTGMNRYSRPLTCERPGLMTIARQDWMKKLGGVRT